MGILDRFKKNHLTKEQKAEDKRKRALMHDLYAMLKERCTSAQDMKTRSEVVYAQLEAILAKRQEDYKNDLSKQLLSTWEVKAQDGKGKEIEQAIIDMFGNEELRTVDSVLRGWHTAHDAFVRKDMLERSTDSLKIELLE